MSLHLVTGHSGSAHVTSADHGALNACMFGTNDYVLNSGSNFAASIITNNQIRIADGELMMQGRHIRLARDTYEDITIENGTQGMNRNDLIVVRYTKNIDSGIEDASFAVIKGTETTGTASDPEYTTGDLLAGDCVLHEIPLYRVPLTDITVGELVPLFDTEQVLVENRQKLNFIGINPIASVAEDTVANWKALGTGIASYGTAGLLINQPQQYGTVFNMVSGNNVRQMWFDLAGGNVYHRGGNQNGWSHTWRKILDETNGLQMEKVWTNASPTSTFASQNITLDLSDADFILFGMNWGNSQPNKISYFPIKVGTSIYAQIGYIASSRSRQIDVTTTKVVVGVAYTDTGGQDNTQAIPVEIYKIKGVQ